MTIIRHLARNIEECLFTDIKFRAQAQLFSVAEAYPAADIFEGVPDGQRSGGKHARRNATE